MGGSPDLLKVATLGLVSGEQAGNFIDGVTGTTAKRAADKARKDQEAYQAGVEKKLYDKTVLDAATLDMQKKRQAQKSAASAAGGRSGTILTSGLSQVAAGQKVLLGE